MTHEIVQIQETDILHFVRVVLDHHQFHVNQVKILILATLIAMKSSILIELIHAQGTLTFHAQRGNSSSLSEKIVIAVFLDNTTELDSLLKSKVLHIGLL